MYTPNHPLTFGELDAEGLDHPSLYMTQAAKVKLLTEQSTGHPKPASLDMSMCQKMMHRFGAPEILLLALLVGAYRN